MESESEKVAEKAATKVVKVGLEQRLIAYTEAVVEAPADSTDAEIGGFAPFIGRKVGNSDFITEDTVAVCVKTAHPDEDVDVVLVRKSDGLLQVKLN